MNLQRAAEATGYRTGVIGALFIAVAAPALLIIYQSFLSAPFFDPTVTFSLDAYRYVLTDPEFWRALWTTALYSFGLVAIAVPLGALLGFLVTRTDLAGRRWLEPLCWCRCSSPQSCSPSATRLRLAPQASSPWAGRSCSARRSGTSIRSPASS